jgi:hypothetical protein
MTKLVSFSVLCKVATIGLVAMTAGCASEHYRRGDGITDFAGDTIAHNTALQVVDPWAEGVEDTDIRSPYDPSGSSEGEGGETTSTPAKTTN